MSDCDTITRVNTTYDRSIIIDSSLSTIKKEIATQDILLNEKINNLKGLTLNANEINDKLNKLLNFNDELASDTFSLKKRIGKLNCFCTSCDEFFDECLSILKSIKELRGD